MRTLGPGTRVGLISALVSCLGLLVCSTADAQVDQPGWLLKAAQARKLLKERQEALADALQLQTIKFKQGKVSFDDVANIERHALIASLDRSATAGERIAALRKLHNAASEARDVAVARFKASARDAVEAQVAQAIVLEVQTELLRSELDLQAAVNIQALQEKRYELLEKAAAQLVAQYEASTIDLARLTQAGRDSLRATAEGNDILEKRIAKLQQCERTARSTLEIAEAKHKGGLVAGVDVTQAKSFLLEVQIEQLRTESTAAMR